MIHAKLNKLPHLSGRVFLLYLLQLSELLEVLILQLHYDWCLCQDSVTKSFFFTSLLFAVSPMAKILTVTLSALQVFHGWLKKLCGSVHLLGLWPSSETENIQLQKAHMAMVSSLSCVLRHFWSRFLGHSKSHVIMCFPLLRQLPAESRQVLVRHFPSAFFQILQLNFFIFPWGFHSPPVASCYFIMRNSY